jgi:predicted RNase H-like nuclease (RuvC/YqgF family)
LEAQQVEQEQPRPVQHPLPHQKPAAPETVQAAIDQVNKIVETLRESLDDMEAVLESLELIERQRNADEAEIDSLRRALNRLQRPREPGHHSSGR